MITATLVKQMDGFRGDARLYKLSTPLEGHSHVVVSAVEVFGRPETMVFGAEINGDDVAVDFMDLACVRILDHKRALEAFGVDEIVLNA